MTDTPATVGGKDRALLLKKAVHMYGDDAQIRMMIEEMSELTKALCKLYRASDGPEKAAAKQCVSEEMVDVQIMLDQMKIIFGDPVEAEYMKLERLANRLGGWPE